MGNLVKSFFRKKIYIIQFLTLVWLSNPSFAAEGEIEEIVIVGDRLFRDTTDVSPTSVITSEDLEAINMSTVDADKRSHAHDRRA